MCLAVPGKVLSISEQSPPPDPSVGESEAAAINRIGMVDFQGSQVEISLAFVPEVQVGNWVLVHAGYALNVLDEQEAQETWQYLKQAGVDVELPAEMQQPEAEKL